MKYEYAIDPYVKIAKRLLGSDGVKTIMEIGARDGVETKAFNHFFPEATIYTFECNPQTVPLWRENTKNIASVVLTEKAVSDKNGTISFFPIDPTTTKSDWKDGNPGASSLLKASGEYPVEQYGQKEITVETTTLKSFFLEQRIAHINLVWMDIQGAELMALRGLEERILDIDIIHTEVEFIQIYKDQPLVLDIKKFMNEHGFVLAYFTTFGHYSGDAVFINKKLLAKKPLLSFYLNLKDSFIYPLNKFSRKFKTFIRKIIK